MLFASYFGSAAFNTVMFVLILRYVANILRNKQAQKRDHRRIISLNTPIELSEDGPIELGDTISERELDARLGRHRRTEEERAQLAIDMADVIARLPKSWQRLLELR